MTKKREYSDIYFIFYCHKTKIFIADGVYAQKIDDAYHIVPSRELANARNANYSQGRNPYTYIQTPANDIGQDFVFYECLSLSQGRLPTLTDKIGASGKRGIEINGNAQMLRGEMEIHGFTHYVCDVFCEWAEKIENDFCDISKANYAKLIQGLKNNPTSSSDKTNGHIECPNFDGGSYPRCEEDFELCKDWLMIDYPRSRLPYGVMLTCNCVNCPPVRLVNRPGTEDIHEKALEWAKDRPEDLKKLQELEDF
jgi:hypothetical protein